MTAACAEAIGLASTALQACTRILWSDNGNAAMAARSMDRPESTEPVLTLPPRGMDRVGGLAWGEGAVPVSPARRTSECGRPVTTACGIGTADGISRKGMGVHMPYLNAADCAGRDPSLSGVHAGLRAQHAPDNAASVDEALELPKDTQLIGIQADVHGANVHLPIGDASDDSPSTIASAALRASLMRATTS